MNSLEAFLKTEVRETECRKIKNVNEDMLRLGHHLMPPVGWLNDPNGLCYFHNEYHVFFQYSPFNAQGGLKVWGHYKSENLIDWEYLGTPIVGDQPYDCHGVYSGSAISDDDQMDIFYTGNVKYSGDYDYIYNGRGSDTIHAICKDGVNIKSKKSVIKSSDYPKNMSCHVRDPKVWKEKEKYYMVLGARDKDDKGLVLLYSSQDKENWNFINEIRSENDFGYMWECPDYFMINDKKVLSISPQGVEKKGKDYNNIYQSGYFVVDGDIQTTYNLLDFKEWDRGFDFYAPQTFLDNRGRRIMIGWMGMPDCDDEYKNATVSKGWQHALTIPREVVERQGVIYTKPVDEIRNLRNNEEHVRNNEFYSNSEPIEILITDIESEEFKVKVCKSLIIEYSKDSKDFSVFFEDNIGLGRERRSVDLDKLESVNIFIDNSAIEIYINSGEEVFTSRFYPETNCKSVEILCDKSNNTIWTLSKYIISVKRG